MNYLASTVRIRLKKQKFYVLGGWSILCRFGTIIKNIRKAAGRTKTFFDCLYDNKQRRIYHE